MYKVISVKDINNLDDVDLYNYKLCYIDDISKTIYDYTPDAKACRETAEWKEAYKVYNETHSKYDYLDYMSNPILKRGSECADFLNPDYIPGEQEFYAYFTPLSLKDQWGDDWNDSPYDCNAEIPYDIVIDDSETTSPDINVARKTHEITIIQVPFAIKSYNTMFPKDWSENIPFCVDDINNGAIAWIYDNNSANHKSVCVYAGINPFDFIQKLEEIEANNPNWKYTPDEY